MIWDVFVIGFLCGGVFVIGVIAMLNFMKA